MSGAASSEATTEEGPKNTDGEDSSLRSSARSRFAPVYAVVRLWQNRSLLGGESLFEPGRRLWEPAVTAELKRRFIESSDMTDRSFAAKLSDQLAGASQEVYLLIAELMYIHLLPLSNVGADRKAANINAIGAQAPEPFAVPAELLEPLALGMVNGGAGYSTNRFYLMSLLIEWSVVWSSMSEAERTSLLADPWAFKSFLASLPQQRSAAQRNALLLLMYPDTFEDIVATEHKRKIVAAFADLAGDSTDVDRQILAIRTAKTAEFGEEFNWYSPRVRALWGAPAPDAPSSSPGVAADLQAMFPEADALHNVALALADAIEAAHSANPRSWSVTRRHSGLALNVANNRVLGIFPKEATGLALPLDDEAADRLLADRADPTPPMTYAVPGDVIYVTVDRPTLASELSRSRSAFVAAVTACAVRNTPFLGAFSEEAVSAIESIAGRSLPRPEVEAVATSVAQGAWIVRMKQDGKSHVPGALERGDVRVFWNVDVPPGSTFDAIKAAILEQDPELGTHSAGNQAGSVFRFITRMKPGDLIVLPDGSDLYVGTVDGEAVYDAAAEAWVRPVVWSNSETPVERSEISPALYSRLRSLLTITDITELADEVRSYLSGELAGAGPGAPTDVALAAIDAETADEWLVDRAWLQEIVDLLSAKKQVIFFGPPGTGKTYLAQKLAGYLTADGGSFKIVQFHPSYAYEDFVEGFRPKVNADGTMVYELRPGPLREIADAAAANPTEPYFLIIDEINRGNLAKIFGELYFLLEYREQGLLLQYGSGGDSEFRLPKNLFVIGTMNTADRSIAIVDAAVRRRFYFVEFSPNEEPIGGMLDRWLSRNRLDGRPAELLRELNRLIGDRDYAIGPSYLMSDRIDQDRELERVWRFGILPLLNELFYGEPNIEARLGLDAVRRSLSLKSASAAPMPTPAGDAVVVDGQG